MLECSSKGYSGSPPLHFLHSFRSGFDLLCLAVPPLPRPTSILATGLHNLIPLVHSVGLESQT